MRFIYTRITGGPEKSALVFLEHQANIFLLDDEEFDHYRFGQLFRCRGGWRRASPVMMSLPYHATWCVIVDLADQQLEISAHIEQLTTYEANVMAWEDLVRPVPLHKGFRPWTSDYVGRAIWIFDQLEELEEGLDEGGDATQ
jgi:Domain of unknown function (DUF1883)